MCIQTSILTTCFGQASGHHQVTALKIILKEYCSVRQQKVTICRSQFWLNALNVMKPKYHEVSVTIYTYYLINICKWWVCLSVPVAALSNAWVCDHSLAGIVGSNPAKEIDVCLSWTLCVVRSMCLRQADPSDWSFVQRILTRMVCLSVIVKPP